MTREVLTLSWLQMTAKQLILPGALLLTYFTSEQQ